MKGAGLDQSIPSLDQKGGEGARPTRSVMRHARSQTRTRRRRLGSAVALLATVLLASRLATLPVNGAGAAPTAWTTYSTSWTNGVVLCSFDATAPVVTVSSPTMNDTGLWASLGEIQEVGPAGSSPPPSCRRDLGRFESLHRRLV